jgi:hypothetical protein
MKKIIIGLCFYFFCITTNAQILSDIQKQNARATGYAIVAARNPGKSLSVYMIKWDGVHDLEYNANTQINSFWHAQAAIKGNFFTQTFDENDFSTYSSVVVSQAEFDTYKSTGSDWWIVCSYLPSFSNSSVSLSDNGNLGIGTTNPDEKLTVKGKIHTQEVRVDMSGPLVPDYVFAEDYKLKSLQEVEDYIKENKHLPEIPSAQEIEKNGLMLAEMNMNLLKKIEELTLYIIEMKKENVNQNEIQNEKIKTLENKLKNKTNE